MSCGIYTITEIETGKVYVGQSKNIEARWKGHKRTRPETLFHYRIVHTLHDVDAQALDQLERFYIQILDCMEPNGFNRTKGGNGTFGAPSDKTRQKISETLKGKVFSEETKRKISEAKKGSVISDEQRALLSKIHTGRKLPPRSEEWCRRISEGRKRNK